MPHKLGTTPPTRTILSINLRFLRHYAEDRTRLEVARYVGVSEQDIKDWEHCLKQPTIDQAYLPADYFNVEPVHLLEVDFGVLSKEARLYRITKKNSITYGFGRYAR